MNHNLRWFVSIWKCLGIRQHNKLLQSRPIGSLLQWSAILFFLRSLTVLKRLLNVPVEAQGTIILFCPLPLIVSTG